MGHPDARLLCWGGLGWAGLELERYWVHGSAQDARPTLLG
jgi:hypothetical protein